MVIKFYATWCNPCKTLDTQLKSLNFTDYQDINIEDETALELVSKYGVRAVPTLVKVTNDTHETLVGTHSLEKLKEFLGV